MTVVKIKTTTIETERKEKKRKENAVVELFTYVGYIVMLKVINLSSKYSSIRSSSLKVYT